MMQVRSFLLFFALTACNGGENGCTANDSGTLDVYWGPERAENHASESNVVEVHLSASTTTVDWGLTNPTDAWAYNGQIPGPVIEATEGQTLRVIFENKLPDDDDEDNSTTIHWHGLRVPNAMDGVSLVQDPIEPGETFEYEYVIPDPGTHWYHPHIRTNVQVERGLHGGMVIHESNGVEVDRDRLFMLDDIDLQPNGALAPFDLDEGIGLDATWGRLGNLMLVNGISVREEPITDLVISGGVERWRLVNNANARTMYIEINGAQWRLIARDGTLIQEPQTLERLQIAAGQRVDLEVLPGESEVDLQIFTRNKEQEGEVFEEIHAFEGVPDRPQEPGEWKEWDPPTFIDMEDASQGVSLLFDGEETSNGNSMEWTINGEMWDAANDLEVLEAGTPSTITVTNDSDYVHPFHMHGNFFQVISIDGEPPDYSARYDTVMVDPQSEIKLYTDFVNPGKWMAHCHILEHAALGMMTAFNVQESKR